MTVQHSRKYSPFNTQKVLAWCVRSPCIWCVSQRAQRHPTDQFNASSSSSSSSYTDGWMDGCARQCHSRIRENPETGV